MFLTDFTLLRQLLFHRAGFAKMLSVNKTDLEISLGFIDPRYPEMLRKANSADPKKYPLLELELVMRELFQEDKLMSVIIASEKLRDLNSPNANFLRLNFYLNFHACRITGEAGYKTLLLAVYKTSLFSGGPKWLFIRPHFFFDVPKWLFIKPYFFLKAFF